MRKISFLALFVLISLFFFLQEASAATKIIRFGHLIDGTGKILTNAVVVVEDDRVKSIANSELSIPTNAEVIDLTRYTGIPALIDVHTHLAGLGGAPSLTPVQLPRHPAIDMFLAQKAARTTLESGVTTVRNLARCSSWTSPCVILLIWEPWQGHACLFRALVCE